MALLTKGVDLFREMTGRNDQLRAEGREEGLAIGIERGRKEGREAGREEGREAGREEGREVGREEGREAGREENQAEIRNRLRELGLDLDELLHSGKNGAGEAKSGDGDEEPGAGSTDDP